MQQPPSYGGGAGSDSRTGSQSFGTTTNTSNQQPQSQGSGTGSQSAAGGAASELSSDAKQLGSTAADRLHSEVDARKSTAADQAKSVSSAIQRTAGELDESAPAWLKSSFQQGADQIQRFAETLEQKDSRQLVNDVQSFARERPGTFLAACAAAGFAAARIFKAGGEQSSGSGQPQPQSAIGGQSTSFGTSQEPAFRANSPGEFV
jgi:hypothetical protein